MRCKPQDLAVIIKSARPQNIGKLVTVIKVSTFPSMDWECRSEGSPLLGMCEFTRSIKSGRVVNFLDSQLRPLRTDETPARVIRELTEKQ